MIATLFSRYHFVLIFPGTTLLCLRFRDRLITVFRAWRYIGVEACGEITSSSV